MAKWYEKVGSELSRLGKEVGKGATVVAKEVGKGATVVAKEVGKGATVVAKEARKTVGVGVGDIKIKLPKREYNAGDTIAGTVDLTLSEPTEAKRLLVRLHGSRKKISYSKNASGRRTQDTHTETVHEFELELGGDETYESRTFEFELPIPSDIGSGKPEIKAEGVLGDVARVVASVATANTTAVSWTIAVVLDIAWKRNVSTKLDVVVRDLKSEKQAGEKQASEKQVSEKPTD